MAEPNQFAYIDEEGFHRQDFEQILEYYQNQFKVIYGNGINLDPDTQDGSLTADAMASPMNDVVNLAQDIYNSFSPATAQSDALSRNVKINGIERRSATFSTADLTIIGTVGTVITDGIAEDTLSQDWLLPTTVTIPAGGEITVTATAKDEGNIAADANTITKIKTPTLGWQSVDNPLAATNGVPVETDGELRIKQSQSVANPALSVIESIIGNVLNVDGVDRLIGYENDTDLTDSNGIPPHSISIVVEGGDNQEIGDSIATTKTPGTGTYGTESVDTFDQYGTINVINFYRPTIAQIGVNITGTNLGGYISTYGDEIAQNITDYINSLQIGEDVLISKLYSPANLSDESENDTYDITSIEINRDGGAFSPSNITIGFNEAAACDIADVTVTIS